MPSNSLGVRKAETLGYVLALAATAGYTAFRTYHDHASASGKLPPDPSTMRDMMAQYTSSEVDKIVATKGNVLSYT